MMRRVNTPSVTTSMRVRRGTNGNRTTSAGARLPRTSISVCAVDAASAALSASGDYGPQLVIDNASKLNPPVLNYFLDYATPGYTQEGPTAAVYNHGWVIGDTSAISVPVQAGLDSLLEVVAQK